MAAGITYIPPPKIVVATNIARVPFCNPHSMVIHFFCLTPDENIMDKLRYEGIIADWREPNVIRIAPVPLYNSFMDCYEFVKRLSNII